MRIRSIVALMAVAVAAGAMFSRASKPNGSAGSGRLAQQRAELAWMTVEATYGGIYDAGYASYTAAQLADLMMRSGNAAQAAPDPSELPPGSRVPQLKPVPYVMGRPSGPWQIVLVPDDSRRVVRVALYGTDLNAPLKTTELAAR